VRTRGGFVAESEALDELFVEVLGSLFNEQAMTIGVGDPRAISGPRAVSRVAVRREADGSHVFVEVRMGVQTAKALAAWMLSVPDPDCLDVLDAVGEVANILAGGVTSLIDGPCQLSLPHAVVAAAGAPDPDGSGVVRRGCVLGQIVELVMRDSGDTSELLWPGGTMEAGR
jgi:hypothetical protein